MPKFNYDDMPYKKIRSTGETVPTTSGFYGPRYNDLPNDGKRTLYGNYTINQWYENLSKAVEENEERKKTEERLKQKQEEGPQLKKSLTRKPNK